MKSYPEYTDSNILDVGRMPSSWKELRFRYVFSLSKGLSITKENLQDEGIPCINYGEIHSKYGFAVDTEIHPLKFVSEDYLNLGKKSLLNQGDLIFADTSEDVEGSGNFTQLVSSDEAFAGYHTIIARPNGEYHPRFLAYFIESSAYRSQIQRAIKGVKVYSITNSILKNSRLFIPLIFEQKVIAAFLDTQTSHIDRLIEEKKLFIKLLEEKRQALISHIVTKGLDDKVGLKNSGVVRIGEVPEHWTVKKIKHSVTEIGQGWSPQCESFPVLDDTSWGVVKVGCVNKGTFNPLQNKKLPDDLEPRPQYSIKKDELLVSRANSKEWVGSAAVPQQDYSNLILCDKIYRIKIDKNIADPNFIAYFLGTKSARQQIEIDATGTSSSMLNIGQGTILNMPIAQPDLEEQNKIVQVLRLRTKKIERLMQEAIKSIDLIKERRAALICAAVTGKIDVRETA